MRNLTQTAANTLEFDVYLLDTDPAQTFELSRCQYLSFLLNSLIYTGGNITATIDNTGSGLKTAQLFTKKPVVTSSLTGYPNQTLIRLEGPSTVAAGSGTIISTVEPGTLMTHFIVNSTVEFTLNSTPNLTFTSSSASSPLYPTRVAEFINKISTQLTVTPQVNAIVRDNPVLNPMALPRAFNVTGTGSYCQGEDGLPVGLDGSETSVTYTLYKDGVAQEPTVNGTGNEITFGKQLFGIYTVTGSNKMGLTKMNGSADITENPKPTAPVPGIITPPSCTSSTGSVVLNGLPPTGTWTVIGTPGDITKKGEGISTTITDLEANTYNFTVTNEYGCISLSSSKVEIPEQPEIPSAPVVGTITPPTCTLSTGSVILNGLPPSGTWTVKGTPGGIVKTGEGTSTTISDLVANTYVFTVTITNGCTSPASANVVIPAQPAIPSPPVVGAITPPTCILATGSVVLSELPASGTWTLIRYPGPVSTTGNGTSTTVSGIPSGIYNFTVTSAEGCVSTLSANVEIPAQPPTPSAPVVGTITQPTCTLATGSVRLTGLPAGNWIINPGEITGSTSTNTITGLEPGTYNFTVTNSVGCISPASKNVVINQQPATPSAPVVGTITQPACTIETGSVILNGLPSTGTWTITRNPGAVTTSDTGTSTTITDLPAGTYSFTVKNASDCTSASSENVVINDQPPAPPGPVVSVDCSLGARKAVITVTSPVGEGLEYRLDDGAYQTSTSFKGVANGSHTVTVRNAYGCTTTGATFSVSCGCANPPTVTLKSTSGSTCGTTPITVTGNTFGGSATSVTITDNGAGNVIPASTNTTPFDFFYTPAASDIGKTVVITVTTNNPEGSPCTAASATYTLTVSAVPSPPAVGSRTHPTCQAPTGSVILNGLPSTGTWELTRSPGNVVTSGTGTSTTVTGLASGTYTFTVTNSYGCTSPSSANVVINEQPLTPAAPVIGTITQPTCSVSTGSVVLNGLPSSGTWIVTRVPGGVTKTGTGTTTTITSIPAGATYTFTVTNSNNCISASSADVVINEQPATPSVPSIGIITPPTCTLTTGSVLLSGLPSSGTWTLTRSPGNVKITGTGTSRTVTGLATGTYTFTVTNASGCTSLSSANVVIPAQPATPTPPVVGTITHPTFTVPTGSVVLSGLPESGTWRLTPNPSGITLTGTGTYVTVSGLEPDTYTFTVTNAAGCTSVPSANVVINNRPGAPNVVITDPPPICSTSTVDLTNPDITAGSDKNLTYTYWLDKDATMPLHNPTAVSEGTYYIKGTLTVDNNTDYFTIKPVTITADQMPVADAGPDQVLVYTFETTMDALPVEFGTAKWSAISNSGRFSQANDPKATIIGLTLGENDFLWTVTNGVCPAATDTVSIVVNELIVPTLITPDMDGKNDYFILRGLENLGTTEVIIFDRRGAQVYRNRNYNNDWNGLGYKNNPLPNDTYFYVIKSANGKSLSGFVVLRRK